MNPVEEDVDFDLAKGYMEGLRISQLKTNRPLPAQFTDGNDDADNLEIVNDKKNQILLNIETTKNSTNDFQTRTQLMSLYSKWEEKLKNHERALRHRENTMLENERALKGDAINLASTSKQLATIKANTLAERKELEAIRV